MRYLSIVSVVLALALFGATGGSSEAIAATTYYVNGATGSNSYDCLSSTYTSGINGPCQTIGNAIFKAGSGDTVDVAGASGGFNGVYCEEITLDKPLTLQALDSANRPAIDGTHGSSACATALPRYSTVTVGDVNGSTMTVTLQGLTVQNGDASNNPSDTDKRVGNGGGIFVYPGASLVVVNSTVRGNTGCSSGSCDPHGGGIFNAGTATLTNSTVSANTASTSSSSYGMGGGIFTLVGSTTLINSTVGGNIACSSPCTTGYGGGIDNDNGTMTLSNTILAGNAGASDSPDCTGTLADGSPNGTTIGDNILGNSSGCTFATGSFTTSTGDQINVDPKLDPRGLQNNGGPTQTVALLPGSPAIGMADRNACQLATLANGAPGPNGKDQRGEPRSVGSCDIGAYQAIPTTYVATTGSDANTCVSASAACRHVGTGLAVVQPGGTVNIAPGTYCEQLQLSTAVTLAGETRSAADARIDWSPSDCPNASSAGAVMQVASTGQLALSHLTVQGGHNDFGLGGGIDNEGGRVTLTNAIVSGNAAYGGYGAGLANNGAGATMTVVGSAVVNNGSGDGSAIFNQGGSLFVVNSTLAGNQAGSGGTYGGALFESGGTATLINDTISGNTAQTGGGIAVQTGSVRLSNTILAGNHDTSGDPDCWGSLADGNPSGAGTVGHNILGNSTGCTTTNLTDHDQIGVDPQLDPNGLQNNGGPTQTVALQAISPAIGKGDATTCQLATLALPNSPPGPNNLDQRGWLRNAVTRGTCDIGAYDTGGPITIAKGWNLIDVPLQSSSTSSTVGLVSSLNGSLGNGSVTALATFTRGAFHLYVQGYTANQTLQPSQGIFVQSTKAGSWAPPGISAYPSGQLVSLQSGWNLVAAPYPYVGVDGSALNGQIGAGCGLQEVVTYSGGGYQTHTPGSTYHVPATAGMWILCTKSYSWTPS